MNISIFLADDHAVVRDGLKLLLENQPGFQVVGAVANGREAVRQIASLRPRIALLDISMPQLNGIEAALLIREQNPDTRVIILSMHTTSDLVFQALKSGAWGYLVKEEAGAEVVKAVLEVHAGRRYLSRKIMDLVLDCCLTINQPEFGASPLARLSPREREVLQLVAEGKSSANIARILPLSPKTVDTYRSRLMKKLGVKDLPGLIKFVLRHGLTPMD
ncbi:MAG: DNA-binding response regulator [Deltaproteobacteria bacterium]|nr:MAG: DNA-binding response regulator [Deltaproteobacteria bacterium]